LGKKQYDFHLNNHFKRLRDLDLVPFANTPEELLHAVKKALTEKTWYQTQRSQMVRDYLHFTDGQSTERLVELIMQMV
jgi:hypothetical protein